MFKQILNKVAEGKDLSIDETYNAFMEIMSGNVDDILISSFLTALTIKGETSEEILGAVKCMRENCISLKNDFSVMDVVGTGGDNSQTFNVSTACSIVLSAAGIPIAKHGNRSASSKCGSADVLEELGVNINISSERSKEILDKINLCFMFAPLYHTAMKNVVKVRKTLGFKTIFNKLGPLCSPANSKYMLLGVYDEKLLDLFAKVLLSLGVERAKIVYGNNKLDEISLSDSTTVCEINNNKITKYLITPEQYNFERCDIDSLKGGDSKVNAQIIKDILNGEKGPKRDIVVLNSAVAYSLYKYVSVEKAKEIITEVIDSKKALQQLDAFVKLSNEV